MKTKVKPDTKPKARGPSVVGGCVTIDGEPTVTVPEAALILGRKPADVRHYTRLGKLTGVMIGRMLYYKRKDVLDFVVPRIGHPGGK